MASAIRDKALVVIQLSGGNDCLNTVVPYTNDLYYDFRPTIHIAAEEVLHQCCLWLQPQHGAHQTPVG